MAGFSRYKVLLAKLGKHKTGESCLYIKRLVDVDLAILRQLVKDSAAHVSTSQAINGTRNDSLQPISVSREDGEVVLEGTAWCYTFCAGGD